MMTDEEYDDFRNHEVMKAAEALRVHFEAVQIFASTYDDETESTKGIAWGKGNIHTRENMARRWIEEPLNHGPLTDEEEEDEAST